MASCLFDAEFLAEEIDSLGETVTIRAVTKASFSDWGDATETTNDTTGVKCFVNVMSQQDDEVKSGIFLEGEIRLWFKGTQTINRGDRVLFNSNWYQVSDLIPSFLSGTTIIKEVRVSKI